MSLEIFVLIVIPVSLVLVSALGLLVQARADRNHLVARMYSSDETQD